MKFAFSFAALSSLVALAAAQGSIQYSVRYDATYDNPSGSINSVACSNLASNKIKTFSDFPTFPNLAAWQDATYNSPSCGSCWNITHDGVTEIVTVIDKSGDGFNVAEETFKALNNGDLDPGSFSAPAFQVDKSYCGL